MTRKIQLCTLMLALLGALTWSLPAAADTVSGAITADNYFVLFWGNEDGSVLNQLASQTSSAEPDGWFNGYTFSNNSITQGSYLYVVAWNDTSAGKNSNNPVAWVGEFTINGVTKYSGLADWQYIYTNTDNPGASATIPNLANNIDNGNWNSLPDHGGYSNAFPGGGNHTPNGGTNIWNNTRGPVPNIGTQADWIWHDHFNSSESFNGYAVYRMPVSAVPLPPSVLLLGSGVFGLGLLGWRRQRG
jgi:hypothetical protein